MLLRKAAIFLCAAAALELFGSAGFAQTPGLRDVPAKQQKRVALVIGNSAYEHVSRLDNPKNDAKLIAQTLTGLGFALVGGGPQIDLDRPAFESAIRGFGRQIGGADVALFYYAGHGVQARDTNWLVPVGANPSSVTDFDYEMIDANLVLRQMQAARTHLNLVILDACRNNPFGLRSMRDIGGGLAQMKAPDGTLISYATQPGNVARDGSGADSPYTEALAQTISKPGLDIFQVFNAVGLEVQRVTGGEQQPWTSNSPIDGDFFFIPVPPGSTITIQTPSPGKSPAPAAVPAVDKEAMFWESIKDSKDPADYQEYLKEYPDGTFAGLARNRVNALKSAAGAQRQQSALAPANASPANEVSATAAGGRLSCAAEPSLKSISGKISATIEFVNMMAGSISTYWLDYGGKRVFYTKIDPGASYTQPTYISHPWVIVGADGACLMVVLPGTATEKVVVR